MLLFFHAEVLVTKVEFSYHPLDSSTCCWNYYNIWAASGLRLLFSRKQKLWMASALCGQMLKGLCHDLRGYQAKRTFWFWFRNPKSKRKEIW